MPMSDDASIPDVVGEIIGFRSWGINLESNREGPRLVSFYQGTIWPADDWLYAECMERDDGEVPHPAIGFHKCGIHATNDRAHLTDIGYNTPETCYWTNGTPERIICFGEVGLAGKVRPGALGWRASKARPLKLWLPYLHWKLAAPLRDKYGVTVLLTNPYERGE
jgi:hypothetical protein